MGIGNDLEVHPKHAADNSSRRQQAGHNGHHFHDFVQRRNGK